MIKTFKVCFDILTANILSIAAFGQNTTINCSVKNSTSGAPVPAVSVTVKGSNAGTFTDDNGDFKLTINEPLPVTLVVSSIGYKLQEVPVSSASSSVSVNLVPESTLGQDIVVSATRTPSRILESPVTI